MWLWPHHDQQFRDLTNQVVLAFSDYPPYRGGHDDVIPHLTIGESLTGTVEARRVANADSPPKLPITARIDHVLLIAGTGKSDARRTLARLPRGTAWL